MKLCKDSFSVCKHTLHSQYLQFQKGLRLRKGNINPRRCEKIGIEKLKQLLITYWIVRRIAKINFYSIAIQRVFTIKLIVIVFIKQSHGLAAIFIISPTHNIDNVIHWNEYVLNVNLFISSTERIWRRDSTIVTFPLMERHIRRYRLMDFYFNIDMVCFQLPLSHTHTHSPASVFRTKSQTNSILFFKHQISIWNSTCSIRNVSLVLLH